MDTVCRESGETDRVEPEEDLVVDGAGLIGDVLIALVLPPHEYECDVCGRMNGYERDNMGGRFICDVCYAKLKDKKNGDE